MQFGRYWKGGHSAAWSLGPALEWRMGFGVSVEQAFKEQVEIRAKERDRGNAAFGIKLEPDPDRPDDELIHYEPMQDRPTSPLLPWGTPLLGVIPADDWLTFAPVIGENGRPTSSVRYASSRIDAWARVEFDRGPTLNAWMALIRGRPEPEPPGHLENDPAGCVGFQAHPLPFADIENYLNAIKKRGGPIPAQAAAHKHLIKEFPHHSVPRARVVKAHQMVFGKLRPGRR